MKLKNVNCPTLRLSIVEMLCRVQSCVLFLDTTTWPAKNCFGPKLVIAWNNHKVIEEKPTYLPLHNGGASKSIDRDTSKVPQSTDLGKQYSSRRSFTVLDVQNCWWTIFEDQILWNGRSGRWIIIQLKSFVSSFARSPILFINTL